MTNTLSLELLPAREGDCILVSYRDGDKTRRALIDGGRAATYKELKARLLELPVAERVFELLVITHVDRDHIEGVLKMLDDDECPVKFRDVWFNGFHHLKAEESFGAVQGERLTTQMISRAQPWNVAAPFAGGAVCIEDDGALPRVTLAGGLTLTLLSPDRPKLAALHPKWIQECAKAGILPTVAVPDLDRPDDDEEESFGPPDVAALAAEPFVDDTSEANGSSIGLLLEHHGRRVLLAGDAHVDRLLASLRLLSPGARLELDALKVSHHGSARNISPELLQQVTCSRYLVSTNGSYFNHPSRSAIARILVHGGASKELVFNYRTPHSQVWDQRSLKAKYSYETRFPSEGDDGMLRLDL